MKLLKQSAWILALTVTLYSCSNAKRSADISNIDLKIEIGRFDRDFWNLDSADLQNDLLRLGKKYPELLPIYLERIVEFGKITDTVTISTIHKFHKDTSVIHLYTDALNKYQDVSDIENKLTDAFKRAKYFFPDAETPQICMHVSGLNQSIVVGEHFISLSTDNYMGSDYPLYKRVMIYNYLRPNMCREKITSDYVTAFLSAEFPFFSQKRLLLDEMIYKGKIIYALSLLMPNEPEHWLIGYTQEQLAWANHYEKDIWLTMLKQQQLFSHDPMLTVQYMNDAPFTAPIAQDSPGRLGVFMGWKIVESYMRKEQDISPLELMKNTDYSKILEQSGYRP